ncbi:MAG: hypothetical protein HOW73_16815, partial [Polyangiaceae bacterium]|nr:hypothetical protein [Polyangiaceae bacterium]
RAACALDEKIASTATWTASAESGTGIVRGGSTCDTRKIVNGGEKHGVVCCDQAVAVVAEGEELQRLTSQRLTDYQVLMNAGSADKLARDIYGETVNFLGKERARDELRKLAKGFFENNPDQGQIYDRCKIVLAGGTWRASCAMIFFRAGKATGLTQILTFNKGANRLVSVGEELATPIQ